MAKALVAMVIVVILAVGGYAAIHKKSPSSLYGTSGNNSSQNTQTPATSNQSNPNTAAAAAITYTSSGFSPASITVKSGDLVAITNSSSAAMQLDSNPHPVHTDDTDLNVGTVTAGQTKTFTVTQKGTFHYHNHLDPSQTGTIIIQ